MKAIKTINKTDLNRMKSHLPSKIVKTYGEENIVMWEYVESVSVGIIQCDIYENGSKDKMITDGRIVIFKTSDVNISAEEMRTKAKEFFIKELVKTSLICGARKRKLHITKSEWVKAVGNELTRDIKKCTRILGERT